VSRARKEKKKHNGKERESIPRVLAGRLGGGGKFNFDPVDSAVIAKFNL
jgi:hypothetical protein